MRISLRLLVSILYTCSILLLVTHNAYAQSVITVRNRTCEDMRYIIVDGNRHDGLKAGEAGQYTALYQCTHDVLASSDTNHWHGTLTCNGSPYINLSEDIIDDQLSTSNLPVDTIIVERNSLDGPGLVTITNKSDCISIQKVEANRGNCEVIPSQKLGALKFGDTSSYIYRCIKLLELKVYTNKGNDTFTFD